MSFPSRLMAPLAAVALLLGACATPVQRLPAGSDRAAVVQVLGQSTRQWAEADGGSTLEYATQPFGETCWMVRLDARGRVVSVRDALAEPDRWQVEPGMDMATVDHLLGRHRSEQYFSLARETVWDWNIKNDGPGIATLYNVHFKDGKVVRTSISYVFPGDGADRQ